jgi:hypothetical protein
VSLRGWCAQCNATHDKRKIKHYSKNKPLTPKRKKSGDSRALGSNRLESDAQPQKGQDMKQRGDPGIYQTRGGTVAVGVTGYTRADLLRIATETALEKVNNRNRVPRPGAGDKQAKGPGGPPPDRQCQHVSTKGKRCRRWALCGASRCWDHGGILDNPHHPSAPKAIPALLRLEARKEAKRALPSYSPQTIAQVEQALRAKGEALSPQSIREGCAALEANDAGKAWRRWLTSLTRPTDEQRARRPREITRQREKHARSTPTP